MGPDNPSTKRTPCSEYPPALPADGPLEVIPLNSAPPKQARVYFTDGPALTWVGTAKRMVGSEVKDVRVIYVKVLRQGPGAREKARTARRNMKGVSNVHS